MREENLTMTVIGVGLMGSSLAGALKQTKRFRAIIGVDSDTAALAQAQEQGYIDCGMIEAPDAVAQADLVILATPVRHILQLLETIGSHLKSGALVLDIGSTKARIVEAMNRLPERVEAIGGHPMTGAMTAGVVGANPAMFRDRVFVLTPTQRSRVATIAWTTQLLEAIGANVLVMDAERHDKNVALISHLPRFVPMPLMAVATTSDDELTLPMAAGGFREKTRDANENPTMWTDVAITNATPIINAIRAFQAQLDEVARIIETGDADAIRAMMLAAQQRWDQRFG